MRQLEMKAIGKNETIGADSIPIFVSFQINVNCVLYFPSMLAREYEQVTGKWH